MLNNFIRTLGISIFYVAVFLYTIIFNTSTGWLFFFFLTFLLLSDFLTMIPSLSKIQIQLTESTIYEANRPNNIKMEIFRYRPTLLKIPLLMINLKNNSFTKKEYLSLYSGQKREVTFEWNPVQRGIFQRLSFVLSSTDLFHLFSKQSELAVTGPFVIMPTLQLDLAELIYQQLLKSMPNFTSSFGNQTFSVRNFRQYQAGDSLNSVDWKQSGKRNELIIKEYEHEMESETHFVFYGLSHENFEELLSIYYSFIRLVETKLAFQQTILAEIPDAIPKEYALAAVTPLSKECYVPAFSNKKLVIFTPNKTDQLSEQLNDLKQKNEIFLITFIDGTLCLQWNDQVSAIHIGGPILGK
ncbi:hypothetical protein RV15_GL002008 [Enterococcus silesiacus]|nr:hypothetical protein RV15_GL002008 [Enterococcus silesiacus]